VKSHGSIFQNVGLKTAEHLCLATGQPGHLVQWRMLWPGMEEVLI